MHLGRRFRKHQSKLACCYGKPEISRAEVGLVTAIPVFFRPDVPRETRPEVDSRPSTSSDFYDFAVRRGSAPSTARRDCDGGRGDAGDSRRRPVAPGTVVSRLFAQRTERACHEARSYQWRPSFACGSKLQRPPWTRRRRQRAIERIVENPHREGQLVLSEAWPRTSSSSKGWRRWRTPRSNPPALQSSIDELAGMQAHAIVARSSGRAAASVHPRRAQVADAVLRPHLCKGCSELLSQQVTRVGGDPPQWAGRAGS